MIKRSIEKQIKKYKNYPVISISGPRQSGKTTLCKKLFKDYLYFNLENPQTRSYASKDPIAFLSQSPKMVIDEIQRVPELFSYIQVNVDEDKSKKYVITGSQNFLISEKISQSLAGRVAIFKLLPFSLEELKESNQLPNSLNETLLKGFYPRIYDEGLESKKWYDDYIETYLERDVRTLKSVNDLDLFHKFLGLLAGRTGQVLNMSSLANDTGVAVNTVSNWISILEASYVIFLLKPFYGNINKRLTKGPKIHFYDSGLVSALLNINNIEQLKTHPLIGSIFESFVVSEFVKKNFNFERRQELLYLRDKSGKEIDLVIQEALEIFFIEAKYGQTFNDSFSTNIDYYSELVSNLKTSTIIYGGKIKQKRTNFELLPWDCL